MKSIKPGRGPSGMSFIGSIVAVIFGVFWTILAINITGNSPFGLIDKIFPLFGLLFIVLGVVQAIYHFKNATGKNRFSAFDIADSSEESDPASAWINKEQNRAEKTNHREKQDYNKFCPFCGATVDQGFSFCPKCGKALNQ